MPGRPPGLVVLPQVRDLLVDPDPKKGPPKVDLRVSSATGVSVPGAMALQVPDAATTLEAS